MKPNASSRVVEVEPERMVTCQSLVTALQQWHRVAGCSERTLECDWQRLNPFWRFLEKRGVVRDGKLELAAITPEIISDYQTHLFDYPNARTGNKITSSAQTNYLQGVQTLFRFLHKTKRLAHDPSHVIKLPRRTVTLPAAILTPQEVKRLLLMPDIGTVLGFRDRSMLEVLWSTGLRINELLTLDVPYVRFEQGLLLVRHGKGNKQRLIPIGTSALTWLRRYIDTVRPVLTREAFAKKRRWMPPATSPRLFLSKDGKGLEQSTVQHGLRAFQKKARIRKRITVHVFRHTLATDMLKAGADLRHIQEMLGHDDLTTTQRYLRVVKEELKRVHQATHPREQMPVAPVCYMREYLSNVRPRMMAKMPSPEAVERVFFSQRRHPMQTQMIYHLVRMCRCKAGLPVNVSTHSLRHTCATEMLRGGANVRHVQEMLGHSQINTTQIYTRVVPLDLKKVHQKTSPSERVKKIDAPAFTFTGMWHEHTPHGPRKRRRKRR